MFSKARIQFSTGGEVYNGRAVSYHYMPDEILENARNVTIQLHNSIGRFVRIRLYFANRWLLLSEVTFDSGKFCITFLTYFFYAKFVLFFYVLLTYD